MPLFVESKKGRDKGFREALQNLQIIRCSRWIDSRSSGSVENGEER